MALPVQKPVEEADPLEALATEISHNRIVAFQATAPSRRIGEATPKQEVAAEPVDKDALIAQLQARVKQLEEAILTSSYARRKAANEQRALVAYGDKSDLAEVKQRVGLLPNLADVGERGQALVAQVAVATGLNPFFHIHVWKQGDRLNITLDYKGLLFLAEQENLMTDSRALTREEMLERGVKAEDIDRGAVGYVTEVTELDKAIKCKQAGITYKPIFGYAVWYPVLTKSKKDGSTYEQRNDPPNGRDGAWVAKKNSLRDALYQVSDLSLKLQRPVEGATYDPDMDGWTAPLPEEEPENGQVTVIEGQFTEGEVAPVVEATEESAEAPKADTTTTAEPVAVSEPEPEPKAEKEPEKQPEATDAPAPKAKPDKAATKRCKNCNLEPATTTPLGDDLCATCARNMADAAAAKQ